MAGAQADERGGRAAEEPVPGGAVAQGAGTHGGRGARAQGTRTRRGVEEVLTR